MPPLPLARRLRLAAVLAAALAAPLAGAQGAAPDTVAGPPEGVDARLARAVYGVEAPALVVPLRVVNDTAYPAFVVASPLLGAGALVAGADLDPALRLLASQALTFGTTLALKNVVRRPRPYAALGGIAARDRGHQGGDVFDPHSFPSGHTAIAFATATSLGLSYPEWYVVVPAAAWAATMGATRVWHGVHYPTDVAAGAALGIASGVAVHALLADVLGGGDDETAAVVPVQIVIPL